VEECREVGVDQIIMLISWGKQWVDVMLHKTKAVLDPAKGIELIHADEHTLVKYLRKHIPCSCLDEKYEEVKKIKKMGICFNLQCSLPNREAERSTMLSCTRCRRVNYCSPQCQKVDWTDHKQDCDCWVALRAAFESSNH